MRLSSPWLSTLTATLLLALALPCNAPAAEQWATPKLPFGVRSPWNSRPVEPVLGTFEIPDSDYKPAVMAGPYSTGVYVAQPANKGITIFGPKDKPGIWNPDAEAFQEQLVLPRWPDDVFPATGSDGHADVVDPITGVIHSFWQLRKIDGVWRAVQYAWSPLSGRGWGDPAHYFQGARAAGVPTMAGLIRSHEIKDGLSQFRHALAMSLTFNALSRQPTYTYPATSADGDAATTNSGQIPEGALMMLPATFDEESLKTPELRKVARTLKTYGAYVVDRNHGTPFVIYVENGSTPFDLHKGAWSNTVANDLQRIQKGLRQVVSVQGWLDAEGHPYAGEVPFNLLSMRGAWRPVAGVRRARFDTHAQAIRVDAGPGSATFVNDSGRGLAGIIWARPLAGASMAFKPVALGLGTTLRLVLRDKKNGRDLKDSGHLRADETFNFAWPDADVMPWIEIKTSSTDEVLVRADLRQVGKD